MTITLPTQPTGEQFEDFVAATLRALGYFIETRVILREGKKEILEIDVVATPVGQALTARELFEAKKDGISFPNLFKLYGQRLYLGIGSACMASFEDADSVHRPLYDAKGAELGVRVCCHPIDYDRLDSLAPARNGLAALQRKIVAAVAWYLQIAKRLAQAALTDEYKRNRGDDLYERLRRYSFEVHASFFGKTPLKRAEALYAAYFDSPKLAGELISRVAAGRGVNAQVVWNEANDTHQHLWIQHQMLLEASARIAIIKHALDDVVERGGAPLPTLTLKIGSEAYELLRHNVPPRFAEGLRRLHAHPYSLTLPYLFQTFLELFGGFLFQDSEDELALLEALTGVPRAEVVPALRLMDEFFAPEDGSMFFTTKGHLLRLKMVPGFVRGIGSFFRLRAFGLENYGDKYPDLGWLLAKWHKAAYTVLEPELRAVKPDPV
jgi:hypothetical protein